MHSILAIVAFGALCAMAGACFGVFAAAVYAATRMGDDGPASPQICEALIYGKICTHLAIPGTNLCRQHTDEAPKG